MLQMMFADVKGHTYAVQSAESAAKANEILKKSKQDIVLLSLNLQEADGLEELEKIQTQHPHLPVVVLARAQDQAKSTEAFRKGAQDFLIKGRLDGHLLSRVVDYAIERYSVMNEMRQKNKELERLNSLKSEFISTVSHELRTPLTVVMSATNNLLDGAFGALSDPQVKWLKKINHHAMRLHGMISDLLDLSKLQSGKSELKRDSVDLAALIKSTVLHLQMLAQEKRVKLKADGVDNPLGVWGDRGRLEQVLTNLITNAFKFTPEHGQIEVEANLTGKDVEISVSDTGPGIAPENQALIFEKFRQIRSDENQESSTKGIGLGLAICKEIITQHRGKIWVESQVGKGSRFVFSVPIDARSQSRDPLRVLVVDDDEEICALLNLTLAQAGYHVTVAKNGKHAIQLTEDKQNRFDVVFLDLMLPGASGAEVIEKIRRQNLKMEIVVVTAYPNSELLFKGMEQGPLTIIAKPFKPESILAVASKLAVPRSSSEEKSRAA